MKGEIKMPPNGKSSASGQLLRLFRLIQLFSTRNGLSIDDLIESDVYNVKAGNFENAKEYETAKENARTLFKRDREKLGYLYSDLRYYGFSGPLDDEDEDFVDTDDDDFKVIERRYDHRAGVYKYYLKDELLLIPMRLRQADVELIEASLQLGNYFLPMYSDNARNVRKQLRPYIKADKSKKESEKTDKLRDSVAIKLPVAKIDDKAFKDVLKALLEEKILHIGKYVDFKGDVESDIDFSPWCIYFRFRTWYVYGCAADKPAPGSYRISRIQACSVDNEGKKSYQPAPEEFSPDAISYEYKDARFPLKLYIYPTYASPVWQVREWFPGEKKRWDDNKRSRLDYEVTVGENGLEEVANWITGAIDCFEIRDSEGAPALRAKIREKLERFRKLNPTL